MITRIVRMSFDPRKTKDFEAIFNDSKEKIRSMPGCRYLSLHCDHHQPNVYYTISRWEEQSDLDAYRHSALFEKTWAATKALFNDKPMAHYLENTIWHYLEKRRNM